MLSPASATDTAPAAPAPPGRRMAMAMGALYLSMGVPAAIDFMLIRPALIVAGDAEATALNMLGGELLFRAGIALQIFASIAAILLAAAYFQAFAPVRRSLARLLVLFIVMGALLEIASATLGIFSLGFIKQPDHLIVFEAEQLNALGLSVLTFQSLGYVVAHIFWGLWLLPLGLLILKSGWMPRAVGVLLLCAGIAYVVVGLTAILVPTAARPLAQWAVVPEGLGELGFIGWMMIFGFKSRPARQDAEHGSGGADPRP